MRNEKLFNNLEGQPSQVIHNAPTLPDKNHETPPELLYSGPKIFVDAAWKKRANGQPSKAGVGIHIT
jgi:hypothetical protein